jgi:hypothetical protein
MFCPLAPVEFKFCLIYFFFFLDLEQGIKVMQGLLKKINLGVVGLPCLTKPTRQVLLSSVCYPVAFLTGFFREI